MEEFGYFRRSLGQAVTSLEVITTLQNIDGVEYIDLDQLSRFDETSSTTAAATLETIVSSRPNTGLTFNESFAENLLLLSSAAITLIMNEAADA